MDILHLLFNFIIHIDHHLSQLITHYGSFIYLILFLIVFCETGLIVMPFLPGDSLVFAAGALAARGQLNIHFIIIIFIVAALCGDNVNYWIGRRVGPTIFQREKSWFFNKDYLLRTHAFYKTHGGKAVIIARFAPIIRTFSPFVAGIGHMSYKKFLSFSILAAVLWAGLIGYISYAFGNLPFIQKNFTYVIFGIIIVSLLPGIVGYINYRIKLYNQG